MIGSKRARLGFVVGVVGLTLATYLVVRSESARSAGATQPSCTSQPIDGGDPQTASGTRWENPQVRLWSRTVTLTMADCGASAVIENGQEGDTVWLDRSRGARDVRDGMLGAATVSTGATTQRTGFFRYAGSLLRACGKVGDRAEIRCTQWTASTDPPLDRRQRALQRLLEFYDHEAGRWQNDVSMWQSANALTAVIDYMRRTGDTQYLSYVEETYRHGDVTRSGVPRKTDHHDDELWWALAWIAAYDLTHDARYLTAARAIVDGLEDAKASFCDGGLAWARTGNDRFQVNTITNALYLTATASLSTRIEGPDRKAYLARAQTTWTWFTEKAGRALFDRSGLINDHLDKHGDTCVLVEENTRWTYDQGALIRGMVALYLAAGQRGLLTAADAIATAVTRDGSPFVRDGVLDEYAAADKCPGPDCGDAYIFKGIFVRDYRELIDTGKSAATREFLTRQATALTGTADRYGFRWPGPPLADDHPNFATQAAALDALNAG